MLISLNTFFKNLIKWHQRATLNITRAVLGQSNEN